MKDCGDTTLRNSGFHLWPVFTLRCYRVAAVVVNMAAVLLDVLEFIKSIRIDFYARQHPFTPFVKQKQNMTEKDCLPSMFPDLKCLSAQSESKKKVKCELLPVL